MRKFLKVSLTCMTIILVMFVVYRYVTGHIYVNYLAHCSRTPGFCGIAQFSFKVPIVVKDAVMRLTADSSKAARIRIPGSRHLNMIPANDILRSEVEIMLWYEKFAAHVAPIVGESSLFQTNPDYPNSCSILIFDTDDDFINWHFDTNPYAGKMYTVLVPIGDNITCAQFSYYNSLGNVQHVPLTENSCVVFDGSKVFNMVSELCYGQHLVVLSLQYVTSPETHAVARWVHNVKQALLHGTANKSLFL